MYSLRIDNDCADLYLYSAVLGSEYGAGIHEVIDELNKFSGNLIKLRINSEGGDIFEAQGMYSYLHNHKARVEVYIDGLCASAASIIAMAGEKIYMPENALFMIHNPSGSAFGESEDMRKLADILDKVRDSMAVIYEQKTGKTHAEIIKLMSAETWYSAKEAKKEGFIDEVTPALRVKNEARGFDEGVMSERERMRALDELNAPGREEAIFRAKYETFQTANNIALDLLKIEARKHDAMPLTGITANAKTSHDMALNISEIINRMRGYTNGRKS